uniref:Uncharacterized protein n=1 Tax=Meloidogyne enterolobii TaxID=390850 RepID=A0A6V7VRY0_MELEN|nr:unnamed protein product [Meloidogyne enterolobii]
MRPEYSYYPTHCVHINNVDDVDQHLSNGPIYLCNDGIAQYITQGMLVTILIVQIALCFLFFWRSSSKKVSDNKKDKKNPSICESITANLELLTPPRLNLPTLLREENDPPPNNSQFSTNSLSTRFYKRTDQQANSSTSLFCSEYSVQFAPFQNV